MKKRNLIVLIAFLVFCNFVGCTSQIKEKNMNNEQNKSILDLIKHIYIEDELIEILQFKGSYSELNEKFPVECLRETETMKYAVYCSDRDIVFVYFDLNGSQLGRSSRYSMQHTSEEFQSLQVGDTLDDVMEVDPDGSYLFLHTGVQSARGSTHCTKDGFFVIIGYDDQNTITSIEIRMI